jgi:type IV pilus assembly protein PilW
MKRIQSHMSTLKVINMTGFTLVELMMTLAISGIVMGAIYSAYLSQQRTYLAQEQVAEMQQNIRAGLDIMEREIRMAGYDPRHNAGATITVATGNNLVFTLLADTDGQDNDSDGTTDETDELETINYRLYDAYGDGDTDLGRQEGAAVIQAVAENIDAIEFYYSMADGTQVTAPAQLNDIRAVQISILARAGREDRDFTNSMTYTTASGGNWPYNDNFRRRLLITTVQCRNMGL